MKETRNTRLVLKEGTETWTRLNEERERRVVFGRGGKKKKEREEKSEEDKFQLSSLAPSEVGSLAFVGISRC